MDSKSKRTLKNGFSQKGIKMTRTKMVFLLMLLSLGCGKQNSNPSPIAPSQAIETGEELTPYSENDVYAQGWEGVVIDAFWAKTTISASAHFTTNRNACGKDAYGAIDLETWNQFAANVNKIILMTPLATETCVDPPEDTDKFMNGTVEVNLENKAKKILFEYKDWQICNKIKDPKLAKETLKIVNQLITTADKEDCPNGWGRD